MDRSTADRICNFNRHYAEYAGYWKSTDYLKEVSRDGPTVYYDSVTGKPLFVAPIGRSMDEFLQESNVHGWPSFRDQEVVWVRHVATPAAPHVSSLSQSMHAFSYRSQENTRVLSTTGETVSADGTHLGHNL